MAKIFKIFTLVFMLITQMHGMPVEASGAGGPGRGDSASGAPSAGTSGDGVVAGDFDTRINQEINKVRQKIDAFIVRKAQTRTEYSYGDFFKPLWDFMRTRLDQKVFNPRVISRAQDFLLHAQYGDLGSDLAIYGSEIWSDYQKIRGIIFGYLDKINNKNIKKLLQLVELRILGSNLRNFSNKGLLETLLIDTYSTADSTAEFRKLELLLIQKYDSLHVRSRAAIQLPEGEFYDAPTDRVAVPTGADTASYSSTTGAAPSARSARSTPGRSTLSKPFADEKCVDGCPNFRGGWGSFSGEAIDPMESTAAGVFGGDDAASSSRPSSDGSDSGGGVGFTTRDSIWDSSTAAYKIEKFLLGLSTDEGLVKAASQTYATYLRKIIRLIPTDTISTSEEAQTQVKALTNGIANDPYAFLFFLEIHEDTNHGLYKFLQECGVVMAQDSKLPPRGVGGGSVVVPAVNIWGTNRFPGKQNASNVEGFEQIKRYALIAHRIQQQIQGWDSAK